MSTIDPPSPDYPDSDRLKQLRSFCQVVRWRSFTRAAEHLGLSQSSVSQQVHSLEAEFAVTLFGRDGRHVAPTSAGENLYQLAASLVAGADHLFDTFAEEYAGILRPELQVAAGEAASTFILPSYIKQFRDEHPETRLIVRNGNGRKGIGWLLDYEVELMIGAMDTTPDAIDFHPLFSCDHVLIVPLDHPLSGRESVEVGEAAAYPAILPTGSTLTRQFGDFIHGALGVRPEVVVEVDGWETLKRYVEAGIGIAVVPELCVTGRERVWSIPMKRYYPTRTYKVFMRTGGRLSLAARTFIGLMDPNFTGES